MKASVVDVLEPRLQVHLSESRKTVMKHKKVKMKLKKKEDGECVGVYANNPVVAEFD